MKNNKKIIEAMDFLKKNGYVVDALWSTEDVLAKFDCTEAEAQKVLYDALTNESTMEQIWYAIDFHGEEDGLTKKTYNGYNVEQVKEYYLNSGFERYSEEPFLSEYDDLDWIEHANESDLEL